MSGGGTTTSKVENKDPWAPAQPYLMDIMQNAGALHKMGAGSQTWGGPLIAGMDPSTSAGLGLTNQIAQQNIGSAAQPFSYGQNLMQSNGLTPGFDQPMATFGGIAQGGPTSSAANLAGMASGEDAGKNPYLMQMLDANAARIGNRVNSAMSGMGRYGSGGHTDVLARSIAEANNPLLAQAYESDRNRMLSASGQIDASNRAQDASRIMGAQGQAGILGQGLDRSAQWAGMMPQLSAMQYDPANRMLMTGAVGDARAQQELDAQRQLFEQQQQMPWQQLQRYLGSVSGLGPLIGNAGTTTGTADTSKSSGTSDYLDMAAKIAPAVLGLLSDRTEKTDIKKVGKDPETGLGIYAYRYKGDPKNYPKMIGPMAQEVERKFPGLTERAGGKLYIKPEGAGLLGL